MRTIEISTETFAALWATRRQGEENEDDILARMLGLRADRPNRSEPLGWNDLQYDIELPAGFRLFREYAPRGAPKRIYEVIAQGGKLSRQDTGERFTTLNALTQSIVRKPVNAWTFWKYADAQGRERPLDELRNRSKVEHRARHKGSVTLEDRRPA